jgi:geranylgeranyl diphosphate synthase, type II
VATEPFVAFLERTRARVDEGLEHYLRKPPACPAVVAEAMRYSVFAGGKRLRPLLAIAAAEAVATKSPLPQRPDRQPIDLALPAACAVEMIHTYSLIHDDLPAMDNDTMRRGRPTLHVVYGEGIAILAGDALLTEAFVLLAREPQFDMPGIADRKLLAVSVVAEAAGVGGMVAGQVLDLQAAGQVPGHPLTLDADGLRAMHARKTGALIRAAVLVGAIHGGADHALLGAMSEYGNQIGLAFQIIDDILDVEGTAAEMGKTVGKDAAANKPTYPSMYGLDQSRAMAEECAQRAHAVLAGEGLSGSQLGAIADWIVSRRS